MQGLQMLFCNELLPCCCWVGYAQASAQPLFSCAVTVCIRMIHTTTTGNHRARAVQDIDRENGCDSLVPVRIHRQMTPEQARIVAQGTYDHRVVVSYPPLYTTCTWPNVIIETLRRRQQCHRHVKLFVAGTASCFFSYF